MSESSHEQPSISAPEDQNKAASKLLAERKRLADDLAYLVVRRIRHLSRSSLPKAKSGAESCHKKVTGPP